MRRLLVLVLAVSGLVAVPVMGGSAGQAVAATAGDDFVDAVPLGSTEGSLEFSNAGATLEPGEPYHAGVGEHSLWYRLVPDSAGELVLDTGGSDFDTVLAVYLGDRVDGLTELASNDDADDDRPDPLTSRLAVYLDAGASVSIAVAGRGGPAPAEGSGLLTWSYTGSFGPGGGDDGAAPTTGAVVTVSTADTVAAALELSRLAFEDGGAPRALLARADLFADTLAGGGLAGDRPLLLTPSHELRADVAAELDRLATTEVLVLGGPAAVSDRVLDQLADLGVTARRAFGPGRIETAVAIADVVRTAHAPTTAIVARAYPAEGGHPTQAFADSMAAGAWAADEGWPVLLSHTDRLSDATRTHLADARYDRVILVGGQAALSHRVAVEIDALAGRVDRVSGAGRAETAVAIAEARGAATGHAVIVDGYDANGWAVGLPAASVGARLGSPVLLATSTEVPTSTRSLLVGNGTASALCASGGATCTKVGNLLHPPGIDCGTAFEHWGFTGCHTEVAGLDTKFFPLPDGRRPQRLAIYFHGDGADEYYENWGFDIAILDWARANDALVMAFVSPIDRSNGRPSWGFGFNEQANRQAESNIETFLDRFGVAERRSVYWSTSGGSWYLAGSFVPVMGDRLPGLFALSCGGTYPSDRHWTWDPSANASARDQSVLFFNYGDQDFLAEGSAAAEQRYRERGFATDVEIHEGAEHCRHPITEPTVRFWDEHLG